MFVAGNDDNKNVRFYIELVYISGSPCLQDAQQYIYYVVKPAIVQFLLAIYVLDIMS